MKLVMNKHLQHMFVPKILPLGTLILIDFLVGQSDVLMVGEIEMIIDDILTYFLKDLFVVSLVDHSIEIFMFEGNEVYFFYLEDLFVQEGCHWLSFSYCA